MRYAIPLLTVFAFIFATCVNMSTKVDAQTPSTIFALPANTAPPASSYILLDNGATLSKTTITNAVQAEIPNAPNPEPTCVISSGTCSVNVAIAGGIVHECVGNADSGDTNGPFIISGAPSPVPSGLTGWHFLIVQPTATSTPTVHIHAVCR